MEEIGREGKMGHESEREWMRVEGSGTDWKRMQEHGRERKRVEANGRVWKRVEERLDMGGKEWKK